MTTTSVKKAVVLLTCVSLIMVSCMNPQSPTPSPSPARTETASSPGCGPVTMTIDAKSANPPWVPPSDIPGGAQSATLQSAAVFAWQEFIALNWPAVQQNGQPNTRDQADPNAIFGDPKYSGAQAAGPLVWHTYRHKVETFPGMGSPHGYVNDPTKFYGYDDLPQYVYAYNQTADPADQRWITPSNGIIPPFGSLPPSTASASPTPTPSTPWINLDEQSEIGLDTMYAGIAPADPFPGQQILFLAKANRAEYAYAAANGWWTQKSDANGNTISPPITATANYIASVAPTPGSTPSPGGDATAYVDPTPGSTTQPAPANSYVSLPNNTIEVKSGWRQLTPDEAKSGRFYTTTVRYYNKNSSNAVGYIDAVWGMVALHIIQKTQTAPYFIYATFSQTDNLLDGNGGKIEDENGKLLLNATADPLNPNVTSKNATSANPATPDSVQKLSPPTSTAQPGKSIYFVNTPTTPTPPPTTQGDVVLNRREHNIPQCVIDVNAAAHAAIDAYSKQNNIQNSVWQYYKLVNVQYQPYNKPAGTTYTGAAGGPDPSTYYQANEVVETDYNLQLFSGRFQPDLTGQYSNVNVQKLITDYNDDGTPFHNTYFSNYAAGSGKAANMGGCMGCHANAQVAGGDFSFIFLNGPVASPEVATGHSSEPIGLGKFRRLLLRKPARAAAAPSAAPSAP